MRCPLRPKSPIGSVIAKRQAATECACHNSGASTGRDFLGKSSRAMFLFEHDLSGKPARALDLDLAAGLERASLVLGALDVGAVFGHDDDSRARADVRRHGGAHAIRKHGRLVGRRGGLTLGHRFGFDHFQRRALR